MEKSRSHARRLPDLSDRLKAVADLVRPCACLYDIGTDHAFLPIELIRRGIAQKAVASDIGAGPIHSASRNIKRFELMQQISTAITPGLTGHLVRAEDTVVMAGLGGLEMIDILSAAGPIQAQLVLQPQKSAMELRLWLSENGYQIQNETLVRDRDRIYALIDALATPVKQRLSPVDAFVGPVIRKQKPSLYADYRLQRILHLQKAVRSQPELMPVLSVLLEEIE